jgi:hypothetical protein
VSIAEKAIEFFQKGEKLIILTLTVGIGGVICFLSERAGIVSFVGLPVWVRPAAQIVWVLSVGHVAIHSAIGLYRGIVWFAVWLKALPERRRKARYDAAIVDRLLEVGPLGREMLCCALYKRSNHIWVDDDSRERDWLIKLKVLGLVEVSSAEWSVVHYKIHPVAWNYMSRFPTKFMNLIGWPTDPWILEKTYGKEMQEKLAEKKSAASDKKPAGRTGGP